MKGKQTALLPGTDDKVGYWLTPPEMMKTLNDEFHFDFDACPYPRPAGLDNLIEEWGDRVWCNPPFQNANLSAWARKAVAENSTGKLVVLIVPVPRFIDTLIKAGAETRHVGEVEWLNPKGQRNKKKGWGEFCLFILRPK